MAVSAACGGPAPIAGARTRWRGMRSPSIRWTSGGACNPAIIWPGPQLPLRDNALRVILPRPETEKSSPGRHHSRPSGIRSSAHCRSPRRRVMAHYAWSGYRIPSWPPSRQPAALRVPVPPRAPDRNRKLTVTLHTTFSPDSRLLGHPSLAAVVPSRAEPFGRIPLEAFAAGHHPSSLPPLAASPRPLPNHSRATPHTQQTPRPSRPRSAGRSPPILQSMPGCWPQDAASPPPDTTTTPTSGLSSPGSHRGCSPAASPRKPQVPAHQPAGPRADEPRNRTAVRSSGTRRQAAGGLHNDQHRQWPRRYILVSEETVASFGGVSPGRTV